MYAIVKISSKIWFATAVSIAIIALGITQPTWSRDYALAISAHPEPFTELYFNDISSLPNTMLAGRPETLHFTIANHESASQTYQYRVTQIENGKSSSKLSFVHIPLEQSARLPLTISPVKAGETLEIIVELPAQHQSIHFRTKS